MYDVKFSEYFDERISNSPKLINFHGAMKLTGSSLTTVKRWIRLGKVRFEIVGSHHRKLIYIDDLKKIISAAANEKNTKIDSDPRRLLNRLGRK